jgi:hypothetical protein
MTGPTVDMQLLARFEAGLDPRRPEHGAVPARVLHHGEMSTIMTIGGKGAPALVYKRLPAFLTPDEAGHFESLHRRYVKTLGERAGLRVAASSTVRLPDATNRYQVVYIVQELIPEDAMCHLATYRMSTGDVGRLMMAILNETAKVFDLNLRHGDTEIGFDADMSNWAIVGYDADRGGLPDRFKLVFLDTNTPLMRRSGHELFDVEPFLRPAPAAILPFIRRGVLPDLMGRYYDFRRIAIELVGRFYDEGRPELVAGMIDAVNWYFLAERRENHFQPVTMDEVNRFHRWDRFIWRAFVLLCRVDRRLQFAQRKPYPYILPVRRRP